MRKLTPGDVERLLRDAADWTPAASPPPMNLKAVARRRPLVAPLRLSGLSALAVACFAVGYRHWAAPAIPLPPVLSVKTVEPPVLPRPVPARLASATKPEPRRVRRAAPRPRPERRRRNWIGPHRPVETKTELAPYRYVRETRPLPPEAISLEETHRVVPIVVTDRNPETGEVRLVPAAAVVSDATDNAYSLE